MSDVAHYRTLPYTRRVELHKDPDGAVYFIARIAEIPPLRIHGDTPHEALLRLDEIFDDVISSMIEQGETIPEPPRWPQGINDSRSRSGHSKGKLRWSRKVGAGVVNLQRQLQVAPPVDGWAELADTGAVASVV